MRYPTVIVRTEVLSSWLTVSGYSRTQLATELGISKGRVSQLLISPEEPSAHLIGKLITLTHLSFDRLFKIIHNESQIQKPGVLETSSHTSSHAGALTRSRK